MFFSLRLKHQSLLNVSCVASWMMTMIITILDAANQTCILDKTDTVPHPSWLIFFMKQGGDVQGSLVGERQRFGTKCVETLWILGCKYQENPFNCWQSRTGCELQWVFTDTAWIQNVFADDWSKIKSYMPLVFKKQPNRKSYLYEKR